ncbi:ZIP family metal transporter [Fulvivirga sedimenti]|uniref:ZIP family metal transporter n=1 Tax=Fulvivirga sedimenti TaxID=2879465 RepID=A0A9X1HWA5_9BACT|nr:ZIP family metal transporter [Fulvivirga sedimenti]MCA6078233.1 ZIP family metal transporter [Fulvivirga sedimenti]
MLFNFLILVIFSVIGGSLAFFTTRLSSRYYHLALIFSGAYLFGITIVHILPELFIQSVNPGLIGVYVLLGFFLQQWLESYTQGVEHGHLHEHEGHSHSGLSGLVLLIALSVHAFLEGALLSHPSDIHQINETGPLLWGIILHKIPAAFALMSVILCQNNSKGRAFAYLLIFALASPAGMLLSQLAVNSQFVSAASFSILFAIVSGNFLHISTTIVFESNEQHKLNYQKWGVAILGAGLAVLLEIF